MIGAVVVGEDAGSTSNFVYTISGNANRESYSSRRRRVHPGPVPWLWTARENELTYVGDSPEGDRQHRYHWSQG